jgi:hypothetical protein
MRFVHSHSGHQRFDKCKASFDLLQRGAPRVNEAANFKFGRTFHKFAQLYRDHCIAERRWSDVEIVTDLVNQAFRATGLSTTHYEEMLILCRRFVENEPIDIERSLIREGGIALDENLNLLPWIANYEYDSHNYAHPYEECDDTDGECGHFSFGDAYKLCTRCMLPLDHPVHRVYIRMQLDEVLIDAPVLTLIVDDFKTDYFVPSQSEIENPESRWWKQAMEYAWGGVVYLYPSAVAVQFRFKFVRWGVTRVITITREDIDRYAEMFLARVRFIEATTEFPATPGEHCRMCPFLGGACPIEKETAKYQRDIERVAARFVYDEAARETVRETLKAHADADGAIVIGGLRVGIFDKAEPRRLLDVQKTLDALRAEAIENPELLLDVSPSKLADVLDADQLERVLAAATSATEDVVVFNLHQNKDELLEIAATLGIPDAKKMKKAALAQAIAKASTPQKAA